MSVHNMIGLPKDKQLLSSCHSLQNKLEPSGELLSHGS